MPKPRKKKNGSGAKRSSSSGSCMPLAEGLDSSEKKSNGDGELEETIEPQSEAAKGLEGEAEVRPAPAPGLAPKVEAQTSCVEAVPVKPDPKLNSQDAEVAKAWQGLSFSDGKCVKTINEVQKEAVKGLGSEATVLPDTVSTRRADCQTTYGVARSSIDIPESISHDQEQAVEEIYMLCTDPTTGDLMLDPVKDLDGITGCRWSLVDKNGTILCPDVDSKQRLFKYFPLQEQKCEERRQKHREKALLHARSGTDHEVAIGMLNHVLDWDPRDKDCDTEFVRLVTRDIVDPSLHGCSNWTRRGELLVNDKPKGIISSLGKEVVMFEGARVPKLVDVKSNRTAERVTVKRVQSAACKASADKEVAFLDQSKDDRNVVRFECREEDKDFIYLALEPCDCSLRTLIWAQSRGGSTRTEDRKVPMPEENWNLWEGTRRPSSQLLRGFRGIIKGLRKIHTLGFAHGSLNSQNILISRDGQKLRAKIADFGQSKRISEGGDLLADMRALGRLSYFCCTRGKLLSRIIDGKCTSLDEWMTFPEARDLIESLIHPDRARTLTWPDILGHPMLWKPKKRMDFLLAVWTRLERDRNAFRQFLIDIDNNVQYCDWYSAVDPMLMKVKYGAFYNPKRTTELIRLIRNRAIHFDTDTENVVGSYPDGMDLYFWEKFPRVLLDLYHVVRQRYQEDMFFKDYFF